MRTDTIPAQQIVFLYITTTTEPLLQSLDLILSATKSPSSHLSVLKAGKDKFVFSCYFAILCQAHIKLQCLKTADIFHSYFKFLKKLLKIYDLPTVITYSLSFIHYLSVDAAKNKETLRLIESKSYAYPARNYFGIYQNIKQ